MIPWKLKVRRFRKMDSDVHGLVRGSSLALLDRGEYHRSALRKLDLVLFCLACLSKPLGVVEGGVDTWVLSV